MSGQLSSDGRHVCYGTRTLSALGPPWLPSSRGAAPALFVLFGFVSDTSIQPQNTIPSEKIPPMTLQTNRTRVRYSERELEDGVWGVRIRVWGCVCAALDFRLSEGL